MYGENSSQVNEYRQKLLQLKDSFNTLENEINQNENELKEYKTALNNTQAEVKELSNELLKMPFDKISSSLNGVGNDLKINWSIYDNRSNSTDYISRCCSN